MQKFDDNYLFRWIRSREPIDDHVSFRSFLVDRKYREVVSSLSPDFLKHFGGFQAKMDYSFRNRMRRQIPPWYWHRMRFCADYYVRFFASIWPELAVMVKDLVYVEWHLHVEPDYEKYRDHLVHMFKVACLGTWMLSNNDFLEDVVKLQFGDGGKNGKLPPDHFQAWMEQRGLRADDLNHGQKEAVIMWAFLFAALFHDFGYGYFYRMIFDKKIERMYGWASALSQNTEPSCASYADWSSSLSGKFIENNLSEENLEKEVKERVKTGFARNSLTLNHSMGSCLFTLYLKRMLINARAMNPRLDLAMELAAEAIVVHDMMNDKNWCGINKESFNVNIFEINPLASILVCCDELAIWKRRRMRFKHVAEDTTQLTLEEPLVEAVKLELNNDFSMHFEWGKGISDYAKDELKENLRRNFIDDCYCSKNGHRIFGGRFFGRQITCPDF